MITVSSNITKEDIINVWGEMLNDMDVPCSQCPIVEVCNHNTAMYTSCADMLRVAFDYVGKEVGLCEADETQ